MTRSAAETMAAIDAAIAEWDAARPDCTVTTTSIGGGREWTAAKSIELARTDGDGRATRIALHILADDYRDDADPGRSVRDELDRHASELELLMTVGRA